MKRKLIGAAFALVFIVCAGYLGGVAYSRHVFAEQMASTVAQLDASPDLTVVEQTMTRGFFHTDGQLRIALDRVDVARQPVQLLVPFRARHGILSTDFTGQVDVAVGQERRHLFADVLSPGHAIDLKARIANLEGRGTLKLTVPTLERDDKTHALLLRGGVLRVAGQPGDVKVTGQWQSMSLADEDGSLALGPMTFQTHYGHRANAVRSTGQGARDDGHEEQALGGQDELSLDSLTLHATDSLPIAFTDIHYTGQTQHEGPLMRYLLDLTVGEASISQQRLGSAKLSATLDQIDDGAVYRFFSGLQVRLAARDNATAPTSRGDWLTLIEPLQSSFFAMFQPSPRLTLNNLHVESAMFDAPLQLKGSLNFDGAGIERMTIDTLRTAPGMEAFIDRLHGDFTLDNAPPLLALIAGVAPEQETLDITFENGTLSVNAQPWYSLE